jgi:drug/metabolite transporter (DMT)-like permease
MDFLTRTFSSYDWIRDPTNMGPSHELGIAILAGLGGMLGWGLSDFLAKDTIDRIGDVPTLVWGQIIGIAPLLLLLAFRPTGVDFERQDILILPVMGIWSGLSYVPTYVAFGKGKVSLLSPIFASYAVVVVLISAFLSRETIPGTRLPAMALVFVGILLITGDPREFIVTVRGSRAMRSTEVRGLTEILTAVLLYSIWLIALDELLSGRDWVSLLLVIRICSSLALVIFARFTRRRINLPSFQVLRPLCLIGLFDVAAFASVSYGFSATSLVSVVAMLSSAFSLPTMVLARAILKERSTPYQLGGSLLVVLGIVLIPIL